MKSLLHYDDNIGSTRRYFLDDAAGGRDRYDEKQEKREEEKSSSYSYYKKEEQAKPLPSLFPSSSNMKNDIDTLLAKHYLNSYMPATSHTSTTTISSSAPDTSSGDATSSSRSFYFATRNKISRKTKPPSRSPLSPLECIQRGERGPSVDKSLASLSNEDDTITEAGITTGATTSRTQRHPSKPRIIADFIPEVHFVGEIKSGHGFNAGYSSLTCKWSVDWGTTWSLLEGSQEGQTQFAAATAAATTNSNHHSSTSSCVWNHPIDLHFTTANMKGWPRIILQVWSLDSYGTASILGYGFTYFPATPAMQELEVKCWRPRGTLSEEISHFFLGSSIRLTQERLILDDAWEKRHNLVTILTGKVTIEISCIMRYFDNQYVCTHAPG